MRMSRVLLVVILLLGAVAAWQLFRAVRAYRIERMTLYPPHGPVSAPDDSTALGITNVSFASKNGTTIRGWYIPSRNGAAIALVHGSSSDRSSVLPEIRLLADDGFGILALDLPGHGESDGDMTFGLPPAQAVEGAADFLVKRPDVHDGRIGVAGFSYGGSIVARAAAEDCRFRSVALVASPADAVAQTRAEYAPYGRAAQVGAFAVYWLRHIDLSGERALNYIGKISPRPLLIIGSAEDTTVPLSQTHDLFQAAGEPKQLVVLPHGSHGRYVEADSTYSPTLRKFFESTLLDSAAKISDCPK